MAFSSGTFSRIYNWVTDKANGVKITASRFDAELDGIATGLSTCMLKDGSQTVTADIPFNSFKLTGVGNAAADTDALNRITADGRYIASTAGAGTFTNTGLKVTDVGGSYTVTLKPGSTLSADKTLTLTTGDANRTLSLGGDLTTAAAFTTSGANALTLTTTGATNVTLPTTGTLATLAGSEALTNKTVNGLTVTSTTGTLTIANSGTLATSGAFAITLTASAATSVTLPTSGTLATLAGSEALTNKTISGSSNTLTVLAGTQLSGQVPVANGGTGAANMNAFLLAGTSNTTTVGYKFTAYSAGTVSSGTLTPDAANGNYQYYTNNGAHTLAAPAADSALDILVTNGASAGAITFSGFTVSSNVGDSLDTTNAHKFIISIRRINSVATYVIKALQ